MTEGGIHPIHLAWLSIGISLVGGLAAGVVGCWETAQRDVL